MKLVTFSTGAKYDGFAKALLASAAAVGLEGKCYSMPDCGGWGPNVNQKPEVLLAAFEELKDDLLYVDADALIVEYPALLKGCDRDVAAFFTDHERPTGGTLYFRNTPKSMEILKAWRKEIKGAPESADDFINLAEACRRCGVKPMHLPPAYCWHQASMRERFPGARPVVIHFCAGEHNYKVY